MNKSLLLAFGLAFSIASLAAQAQTPPAADKPAAKSETHLVEPAEAKQLIDDKKVIILDVRTPAEFSSGHLAGAINLNFQDRDFTNKIAKLDTNKAYLVHCAVGMRSAKACEAMKPLSFKSLYDLKGGLSAWKKAGYALEK